VLPAAAGRQGNLPQQAFRVGRSTEGADRQSCEAEHEAAFRLTTRSHDTLVDDSSLVIASIPATLAGRQRSAGAQVGIDFRRKAPRSPMSRVPVISNA
jgi:hypothetical protein